MLQAFGSLAAEPLRSSARGARAWVETRARDMRVLVVCRGGMLGSAEGDHVQGFETHGQDLEDELGVTTQSVVALGLSDIERAVDAHPADMVLVMLSWAVPPDAASALFERLTRRHAGVRFVLLDYYAPSSSPHFGVLPYVDRYVKRQVLRERALYLNDYDGGNVLTDYLANHLGFDLEGWHFGVKPDPAHMDKIVSGWNLGVTRRNCGLLRFNRVLGIPWEWRPIAIHRRVGFMADTTEEWYHRYRELGLRRLEPLTRSYRSTGVERVSRNRYLTEMMFSRVVFSPFGWGELCFRDYEAVCSGCLLVKPSMSHLETSPDIFSAYETYVPVRWDFSDLEETCHYYLTHPDEARAIVENAQDVMRRYFQQGGFVVDVRRCLPCESPDGSDR